MSKPKDLDWRLQLAPMAALLRRELFERVRTVSHFVMRSLYVLILFVIVVLFVQDTVFSSFNEPISRAPQQGRTIFGFFASIQFGLVALVIPLIGAGSIVEERIGKSLPLLTLTDLSSGHICSAKFLARLGVISLIVLSNIPMLSLVILLGGVEFVEIIRVFCMTISFAAMYIGITIGASSVARSTAWATMISYGVLIVQLLSLILLAGNNAAWFRYWNLIYTLAISIDEPLNLGHSWWVGSLVNFAVGGLGIVFASYALRRSSRRTVAHSNPSDGQTTTRAVWNNPIAWREWVARGHTKRLFIASSTVGVVLAFWGAALVWDDVGGHSPGTPLRIGDDVAVLTLFSSIIAVLIAILYTIAVSSSAFSQEKHEQTLSLLQLTSLTPREIVLGKYAGVGKVWCCFLLTLAPLGLVFSIASSQASYTNDNTMWAIALMWIIGPLSVLILLAFFGGMGVFYGLVSTSPLRAALPCIGTFLFLFIGLHQFPTLALTHSGTGTEERIFALAISHGITAVVVFVPLLALLLKSGLSRSARIAGAIVVWYALTVFGGAFAEHEFYAFSTHPFMFLVSIFMFMDSKESNPIFLAVSSGFLFYVFGSLSFFWASCLAVGARVREANEGGLRPGIAALLSVLLPGSGHLALGYTARGVVILVVALCSGCMFGVVNLAAAIDAWRLALRTRDQLHSATRQRRSEPSNEPERV